METPERPGQRELFITDEQKVEAQNIVAEEMGSGFWLDFDTFPKNVGVQGDEGVRGISVMICSDQPQPAKFLAENYDLFAAVSTRLCNEAGGVITRVLFDFTPPDASAVQNIPLE